MSTAASLLGCCNSYVQHVQREHKLREEQFNCEFCWLASAAALTIALLVIGILGAVGSIPIAAGGAIALIVFGGTGLVAAAIASCHHCYKRLAYNALVASGGTLLTDTVTFLERYPHINNS